MHFVENEMVRHENEYQWTSMATENPWLRQGLKENRRSWWAHWSNKITISRLWKHFCSKRNANNKSVIRGLDPRQSRQFSSGSRQWQETVGQGVVRRGRRSNILRLKDGRWEMFVPNWHGNTLKKILWYAIWIPAVFDTLLSNLFVTTYKHHLEFFPWPCSARCGGQDGHEASSSWNQGMARVCVWPSHKSISVMLSEWLESRSTIHVVLSRIINESYNDWLDLLMRDRFQVPMANRAACVGVKPSQETREWWQRSSTMEEQSRMGGPSPFFEKAKSSESFRGTGFGVQERLMKFYASARTERVTAEATSNCVSTTCWVEIIGSCMFLLYQSRINHSLYRSADSFTVHLGTTYDSASVITSRFDQDYLLILFRSLPFVLPLLDCEASCLIRAHRTWHGQSRRPKPAHWDQRIFLNFSGGWYNDWSTCLQLSSVFFSMTNLMYSRELLIQLRRLLTWYFTVRVGVRRHPRRQCRFFSRRQVA